MPTSVVEGSRPLFYLDNDERFWQKNNLAFWLLYHLFFRYSFCCSYSENDEGLRLEPGPNRFLLRCSAGPVGQFSLNQLSIQCMNNKLDLLTDKWPMPQWKKSKFFVKTEQHSFSVDHSSHGILWAGFPQEVQLKIFTGSHHLVEVRAFKGLSNPSALIGANPQLRFFIIVAKGLFKRSEMMT